MRQLTNDRLQRLLGEILREDARAFVVERETESGLVLDISLPIILESTLTVPLRMVEDEPDDETLFFLKYHLMNEAYNTITSYMKDKIFSSL